jgi:superfamily II RNA helicase
MEATEMFVRKSLVHEQRFSDPISSLISVSTEEENSEVLEIITNYGSSLYSSKQERELLTTSEFRDKLAKIQFICQQPSL